MLFLSLFASGKAHVFIVPVDLRIMEHEPVVSQNDFVSVYFPQYELHVFDVSSNEELHIGGVFEGPSGIHGTIHVSEHHGFVHFLVIELESPGPVEVHN